MIAKVHIPVFCADEASKASALLAFKTIRVGFPTAKIVAHLMGGGVKVGAPDADEVIDHEYGQHHEFVRFVVESEKLPFALVDSDVVFFDNCEEFATDEVMAGEFIPPFQCPVAKAMTASRLHTAFLIVPKPDRLRLEIASAHKPALERLIPSFDPYRPTTVFVDRKPVFFDTCSVLFHALGGESFDCHMLNRFEHCWGGSYANELFPNHQKFIDECYADPSKAKGFRKKISGLMK